MSSIQDMADATADMPSGLLDMPADLSSPDMRPDEVDLGPPDMTTEELCAEVQCDPGQVCQAASGECTLPQSCHDRQALIAQNPNAPLPSDGFYQLFARGDASQPWWAWCAAMRTAEPRDYLPLAMTHDSHNVFERFGEPVQPGGVAGSEQLTEPLYQRRLTRTRYEQVRIDPYTLTVDVHDDTFASTEVFQDSEENLDKFARSVPFGVAQGCALQLDDVSLREDAQGRLDLRGTPFKVDQRWSASGVCPAQIDTSSSSQDQVVSLNISGGSRTSAGCGVVAPAQMASTYFASGCDQNNGVITPAAKPRDSQAPLFALQLAYVGGEGGVTPLRPKTCEEALVLGRCVSDGVCDLYVGRSAERLWKAKCVDMATADPKTFIEIHLGRANPVQDDNTSNKVDATGVATHGSFYGSLLIDGHSMRADITDTTFANRTPGVPSHQLGLYAVAESCFTFTDSSMSGAFARARATIKETDNQLRFASPLTPYGECVKSRRRDAGGDVIVVDSAPIFDPISMADLIFAGDVTTATGDTRPGCGGLAPEPYALKQGYLGCREDGSGEAYRAPRYSTEDALLFEFAHVSGNP